MPAGGQAVGDLAETLLDGGGMTRKSCLGSPVPSALIRRSVHRRSPAALKNWSLVDSREVEWAMGHASSLVDRLADGSGPPPVLVPEIEPDELDEPDQPDEPVPIPSSNPPVCEITALRMNSVKAMVVQ